MASLLLVLFLMVCVLLVVVVLLQKGRGGGLGAAFGGAGSSAFGTRTGDVFTWVTIVLTGLFLLLAVSTTLVARPEVGKVLPVILDPPGGHISEKISVTMRCPTRGAILRYTINGSEPTENTKNVYHQSAITVYPGDTVRVKAFRAGYGPSDIITAVYAEPTTQPTTQPAAQPAGDKQTEQK